MSKACLLKSLKMAGGYINFGVNELRQIPIADTTIKTKLLIGDLVEYIIFIENNKEKLTDIVSNYAIQDYFKNILNGCVYELYFKEHMLEREINIIDSALELIKPIIHLSSDKEKADMILDVFMNIKKTDNPIRNRLDLFTLRSPEILKLIIEG